MNRISVTCLTLLLFFVTLAGTSRAQNLIADQERQQRQIDELKRDVDDLKKSVLSLKKIVLRQFCKLPSISETEPAPQPPKKSIDTLSPAEQKKIRTEVCANVGVFFDQVDRALSASDPSQAQNIMNKAVAQLTSELDKYEKGQKLQNLLSLAEALSWDTYVAVQNRESVAGNADFISYIQDKKERYRKRCMDN